MATQALWELLSIPECSRLLPLRVSLVSTEPMLLLKQLLRKHQNKVAQSASSTMDQGASQTQRYQQPNNSEENSSATSRPPHVQSQAPRTYAEIVMELQREWERLKRRQLQLEQEWASGPSKHNFFSELVLGTNVDVVEGCEGSQPPQPDKASFQDGDPIMSDKASQDGDTKMSASNN
ncbi:hypothetical protein ACRE_086470 [Hapsidospora chrysogenum ATCC 11550]|uniref:Uncharacterized protein n=1 Tax=Hapsidospora chrysogenum (strain ATCC 11550 / CBS 779.69 / DSM 880 / IAM 14645 / JCM 23072 / IMI 49137) TaxID=857340 RepID=A0A086SU78_HAPC1|nr:hypothetical protein ACRE_086470 [Hapsidospora chrysogenum ATCC 11550]